MQGVDWKNDYFNFSSIFGDFFLKQSNKKESRVEQNAKINVFPDYSLTSCFPKMVNQWK